MAKTNSLKKTLLMSGLTLLMSGTLLAGATYAWFSSEVETGVNTIVAGKLKVDLVDDAGESLKNVPIFEDILWEPGAMLVSSPFKVVNLGDVALFYSLTVNMVDETFVTFEDGTEHGLSDVIKFKTVDAAEYAEVEAGDREAIWELDEVSVSSNVLHANECATKDVDECKSESDLVVAVLYWEPNDYETDNLYNVDPEDDALVTKFSLKVYATQTPHEKDSFGSDYDARLPFQKVNQAVIQGALDAEEALNELEFPEGTSIHITPLVNNKATVTFNDCDVLNIGAGYQAVGALIQAAVDQEIENGTIHCVEEILIGGYPAGTLEALLGEPSLGSWLTNGLFVWGYYELLTEEEVAVVNDYIARAEDAKANGRNSEANGLYNQAKVACAFAMTLHLDGASCDVDITTTDDVTTTYTLSFVVNKSAGFIIQQELFQGINDVNDLMDDAGLSNKVWFTQFDEENTATCNFYNCEPMDIVNGFLGVLTLFNNALRAQVENGTITDITVHETEVDMEVMKNDDLWVAYALEDWCREVLLKKGKNEEGNSYTQDEVDALSGMDLAVATLPYLDEESCTLTLFTEEGEFTYTLAFKMEGFSGF